jgi:glutamate synthase domain-containing protein 2
VDIQPRTARLRRAGAARAHRVRDTALLAFALGCDVINVGREALLSIGCIQALRCHTNHCSTGIATQHAWLSRGLDPGLKSVRLANYVVSLRKELLALSHACSVHHPAQVTGRQIEMLDERSRSSSVDVDAASPRRQNATSRSRRGR